MSTDFINTFFSQLDFNKFISDIDSILNKYPQSDNNDISQFEVFFKLHEKICSNSPSMDSIEVNEYYNWFDAYEDYKLTPNFKRKTIPINGDQDTYLYDITNQVLVNNFLPSWKNEIINSFENELKNWTDKKLLPNQSNQKVLLLDFRNHFKYKYELFAKKFNTQKNYGNAYRVDYNKVAQKILNNVNKYINYNPFGIDILDDQPYGGGNIYNTKISHNYTFQPIFQEQQKEKDVNYQVEFLEDSRNQVINEGLLKEEKAKIENMVPFINFSEKENILNTIHDYLQKNNYIKTVDFILFKNILDQIDCVGHINWDNNPTKFVALLEALWQLEILQKPPRISWIYYKAHVRIKEYLTSPDYKSIYQNIKKQSQKNVDDFINIFNKLAENTKN